MTYQLTTLGAVKAQAGNKSKSDCGDKDFHFESFELSSVNRSNKRSSFELISLLLIA